MKINVKDEPIRQKMKIPPLGQRIKKTGYVVFLCLLIHFLRGYRGTAAQSCITAIICMQPFRKDRVEQAIERVIGTFIGAGWGLLFLQVMKLTPIFSAHMIIVYVLMAVGVVITLYSTVILKQTNIAGLAAIVFLGVVINYPEIEAPLTQTYHQVVDTFIGIFAATLVDVYQRPREKHPEYLFFVALENLVPDRYAQVSSQILVVLNRLYDEGARVTLVSKWAPAFLISQMGTMNITVPVIVMDGAALYDIPNKQYLNTISISKESAGEFSEQLLRFCGGYCLYTVRESNMSVYRRGQMNAMEEEDYRLMKRSPYRNYVSGEMAENDKIAFIRVINTDQKIDELEEKLRPLLHPSMRMVRRRQPRMEGCSGLYFYDKKATTEKQKEYLIQDFKANGEKGVVPVDMISAGSQYSERKAVNLLNKVLDIYFPVKKL